MDHHQHEELSKTKHAAQCGTAPSPSYGELRGLDGIGLRTERANLRQRTYDAQFRAERESRKAGQMAELGALLDNNPDVARILDLIEEVGR